jgi:hypothetical protein
VSALLLFVHGAVRGDLAIETETARLVAPGHVDVGAAFEFQTSAAGQEYALPAALEFGILPRLEALIEPVPFTSIRPTGGEHATGVGDLETTLTALAIDERRFIPAVALAGEVKFPTARNRQIGSGEYDYRIYGILSKRFGNLDAHFNLGYNFIGSPPGVSTSNPVDVEAGAEWFVDRRCDLFVEFNYIGSAAGSSGGGEGGGAAAMRAVALSHAKSALTSEIAGEEMVGSAGVRFHLSRHVDIFSSFSYDKLDDKLLRTGITVKY